ncbi:MAG: S1 RNA-binding domain-containing protein [Chloroflexota bacterium]
MTIEATGGESCDQLFVPRKGLRWGDLVMGRVVTIDKDGAWISIGFKTEAIIPPGEMRTTAENPIQPGQEVLVYVLQPPRDEAPVLLSLDQARKYQGWHSLEQCLASGELVQGQIIGHNKGGLVVRCQGVPGFVPNSQLLAQARLQERVGQQVWLRVMEVSPSRQRLILSERAAARQLWEQEREHVLSQLVEGEKRLGKVTGIHNFGVFVDVGGVEGLVPLSELSWERGKGPGEIVQVGQELEVLVMKVDSQAKRLLLSHKRTQSHPWEKINEKYQVGMKVMGTVTRLMPFGAFVRLDSSIEGLVHISELAHRRIVHPKEVVTEEQELTLMVISINSEKRQMRLSLRQAQEEEEAGIPAKRKNVKPF